MNNYEENWLKTTLLPVHRSLCLLSAGAVRTDEELPSKSRDALKEWATGLAIEIETVLHAIAMDHRHELSGELLHGIVAYTAWGDQLESDHYEIPRCHRRGWMTEHGCACRFPDGTPLIHEAWVAGSAKVLNQPGQPEVRPSTARPLP